MDSTVAGLLGAIIGALAVIGATLITSTLQARQEHRKWLRERKQEAYANSMKYLQRVLNKRSEIGIEAGVLTTIMGKEVQKEWFDDMNETVTWMTILALYCSSSNREDILKALDRVKDAVLGLMEITTKKGLQGGDFLKVFSDTYQTILYNAIQDIAGEKRVI